MDNYSLAHSKWNCKYHIVFTPKYRRQIIYKKIPADIGQIIRKLCAQKGVEIIEAAAMRDHIHLYVAIPPKFSVSEFVGFLKGKSSLMIFDRHANLKYKYGNRHFWCRGYFVDTVGRNEKAIQEYVRNQLQEDIASDQMCHLYNLSKHNSNPSVLFFWQDNNTKMIILSILHLCHQR